MKIVIAGGSGQVGTILARYFAARGDEVVVLSRSLRPAPWKVVEWDGASVGEWRDEVDGCDVLINLAGRSVNCRYGVRNRRKIMDSSVLSTRVLHDVVARSIRPPRVWLNASTATIYRHSLGRAMDEATGELGGHEVGVPETWRFSISVAKAWEEAFFSGDLPGVRRVALRSAMIFSPDAGGVFDVFLGLVRRGLGGTNLPGDQFVSWIHETDLARAVAFLIEREEMMGAVNLAAPNPVPNREFLRLCGRLGERDLGFRRCDGCWR